KIGKSNSEPFSFGGRDVTRLANICKLPVAAVLEQVIRGRLEFVGMAICPTARSLIAAEDAADREIPIQIAGDKKIEAAIVVVVKKSRTGSPSCCANAGHCSDIRKCAISVVAIEHGTSVIGDKQIGKTIVVVVGGGDAHAIA